jgi:hypothetical protein
MVVFILILLVSKDNHLCDGIFYIHYPILPGRIMVSWLSGWVWVWYAQEMYTLCGNRAFCAVMLEKRPREIWW